MPRAVFLLSAVLLAQPAHAVGDLLVAPTRVVLDGARGAEVILSNKGSAPATYRVSLELRRMDASGKLVEVSEAQADAREQQTLAMISYAPRRVVLAPEQPQAIRIGVRAPEGLPNGEYRAHMLFRAVPDTAPVGEAPKGGLSIALTPIYGVTIPIIVRRGALQATAALANPRRCTQGQGGAIGAAGAPGTPSLCFDLARQGTRSLYGRVRVTRPGLAKPLLEARGVAVYAESPGRVVALPVDPAVAAQLTGPVRIEYLEDDGSSTIAELQGVVR